MGWQASTDGNHPRDPPPCTIDGCSAGVDVSAPRVRPPRHRCSERQTTTPIEFKRCATSDDDLLDGRGGLRRPVRWQHAGVPNLERHRRYRRNTQEGANSSSDRQIGLDRCTAPVGAPAPGKRNIPRDFPPTTPHRRSGMVCADRRPPPWAHQAGSSQAPGERKLHALSPTSANSIKS